MKFSRYIDQYMDDMRSCGRINSDATERSYRSILNKHCDDVKNRDAKLTGRDDVKRTLKRWANPNTQRTCRAMMVSFYDWMVEEGLRPYNPARQTRRPKKRPVEVYRLTHDETTRMLQACIGDREHRVIWIGCCAGLRSAELRGLQGRHLRRDGYVWVSADIAKGGRERYVPIIPDLQRIADDIRVTVAPDEYVLPALRWEDPPKNTLRRELPLVKTSPQGIYYLVKRVAERARIAGNVHPHTLRHAFADHIARVAGVQVAQQLLGHADLGTTQTYIGAPTLDALTEAVKTASYGLSPATHPSTPVKATTGIEPVYTALQAAA
jgi:site-specific recombinase XerD